MPGKPLQICLVLEVSPRTTLHPQQSSHFSPLSQFLLLRGRQLANPDVLSPINTFGAYLYFKKKITPALGTRLDSWYHFIEGSDK